LSVTDEPISFEQHIKPLFRERDRQSMKWAFDLWSHDDVASNSEAILGKLRDGRPVRQGLRSAAAAARVRASAAVNTHRITRCVPDVHGHNRLLRRASPAPDQKRARREREERR
jgi:hypothetical protein